MTLMLINNLAAGRAHKASYVRHGSATPARSGAALPKEEEEFTEKFSLVTL